MRRSEATALTWADLELRDNGSDLLQIHRSKTAPEGEGVVIYSGRAAVEALQAIRLADQLLDRNTPVFGLSSRQTGRRVQAAAKATPSVTGTPVTAAVSARPRTWQKAGWSCRR